MRDRFLQQEVWERMGVDVRKMVSLPLDDGDQNERPVPAAAVLEDRAELQEARPARRATTAGCARRSTEIGVIQFEDWADTGEEYELLDELAKDRAAAAAAESA